MDCTLLDASLTVDLNIDPLHNIDLTPHDRVGESKPSVKEQPSLLIEELNRMSTENKKLTEMLFIVSENYHALRSQLMHLMQRNSENEEDCDLRKRKAEGEIHGIERGTNGNTESSCSDIGGTFKRPKEFKTSVSMVYVRTDPTHKSLVVKDGYQWRKYGQKVTRDNPSPRAYYKCSLAPNCTVKKKVQRSLDDPSVLVATYDGEHNHPHPYQAELSLDLNQCVSPGSTPGSNSTSSGPTVTFDPVEPGFRSIEKQSIPEIKSPALQQVLVEQMASSLTRNPSFRAALAAAISGRILDTDLKERW